MTTTTIEQQRHATQRVGYPVARAAVQTERKGTISRISGLAVPYNTPINLGFFTETIRPGCFTRSIAAAVNGLPLLAFHDTASLDAIIGRSDQFIEKSDGLYGEWLVDDSDSAQRAAHAAFTGSLGYLSVQFIPVKNAETFDRNDQLHIERVEARLLEVSMTPTPAYPTAAISDVRSATAAEVAAAAITLAGGNVSAAEQLYVACIDPNLTPAQRDATSAALLRWAPSGPRYASHAIRRALSDPAANLHAGALARLGIALAHIDGTPEQRAASASAIRRDYLGNHADQPSTPAVSRRRRR